MLWLLLEIQTWELGSFLYINSILALKNRLQVREHPVRLFYFSDHSQLFCVTTYTDIKKLISAFNSTPQNIYKAVLTE